MKSHILITLLAFLTMIGACRHQYNREIIIDDVSKARTDTIGFKLASHEGISHLSLSVKGNLNGKSQDQ
ncbi:MAG: hypothetical protein R8G66_25860 [Cytophagales bacterium]|nr:hypothetical protein [Cytophagales bacterium]